MRRFIEPVEGTLDSFFPVAAKTIALERRHGGSPDFLDATVGLQFIKPAVKTRGKAGGVGCTKRGGLAHGRTEYLALEDVCLELHEEVVSGHAAVGAQLPQSGASVLFHGNEDIACLESGCLKNGPSQMGFGGEARETGDDAARGVFPVWGVESGKRRYEVDASVIGHRSSEFFNLVAALEDAEVVAHPLDESSGDGDAALKSVAGGLLAEAIGEGGEQSVARDARLSRIHEEKTASSVGIFGFAGVEARLADKCGLLVPEDASDGDACKNSGGESAVDFTAGADLGQDRTRNAEEGEEVRIPIERVQVHQLSTAGVGDVGGVNAGGWPSGKVPEQKGIDVAEEQIAALGGRLGTGNVLQQPLQFERAEVGAKWQAGLCAKPILALGGRIARDGLGGARILPDDGVGDGRAGVTIPDDGGFALIGDAERSDGVTWKLAMSESLIDDGAGAFEDLHWIVLDPTGLWIDLLVLLLCAGDDAS